MEPGLRQEFIDFHQRDMRLEAEERRRAIQVTAPGYLRTVAGRLLVALGQSLIGNNRTAPSVARGEASAAWIAEPVGLHGHTVYALSHHTHSSSREAPTLACPNSTLLPVQCLPRRRRGVGL